MFKKSNETDNPLGKALKRLGGAGIGLFLVVLAIIGAMNSTYTINEQEQAVLVTLGQARSVTTPGLHFKIPFIQDVIKVDTTIQGFSIGYDDEYNHSMEEESLMITSDYNFVNVDFFVEYRYSDPVKAVYASNEPVTILKNISRLSKISTIFFRSKFYIIPLKCL